MRLVRLVWCVAALSSPSLARAEDCQYVGALYEHYLTEARACSVYVGECMYKTVSSLACKCTTFVNPANQEAIDEMEAARARWVAGNCDQQVGCVPVECPVVVSAVCSQGRCVDGPPYPPPDPPVDVAIASRPSAFSLDQNQPNPFQRMTGIAYSLDRPQHVTLAIYDIAGKRVAILVEREMEAGHHAAAWNGRYATGRTVESGIYYLRLTAGGRTLARTAVLLR